MVERKTTPRREPKRDRVMRVYKLLPEDRELLVDLAESLGEKDRHHALLRLVSVLKGMRITNTQKRENLQIGIPDELYELIDKKAKKTGRTQIDILLMAARQAIKETQE